ncbi:MAG: zinc ABC transporter substrate-binding protein [Clostridiales bacterium]|nr:zinc ABC transporter substrate-binding protein [Clostridiales bacterium]
MDKRRMGAVALLMAAITAASALITVLTGRLPTVRQADSNDFHVVASFYPVYIAALNIASGIDGVTVVNLVPERTGCLHDYQLSPGDMITLRRADLLLMNGAGAESFLTAALHQFPALTVVDASENIPLLESGTGHSHDHGQEEAEDHTAFYNEHLWVSPARYARQVENLREGLCAADPEHAAAYRDNAERYLEQIAAAGEALRQAAGGLGFADCVTFHDSVAYLAEELGLHAVAALALGEESGLAAADAAQAQQAAAQAGRILLLYDGQYPVEYEYIGAGAAESRTLVLDTAVTGPAQADAWLAAMQRNLNALKGLISGEDD